ncbi:hypothetical protein N7488_009881 [Penicillium malachiteum]|nr:hypothetical protein N7488_009881 [Penicillium malachiteum]
MPGLAERVGDYNLKGQTDEFEAVRHLLGALLPPGFKAYLVIDGLDDCEPEDRRTIIQEIRWLQQRFSILLCASVRKEPRDPSKLMTLGRNSNLLILHNASDIEIFIETELEARITSGKLMIGNPLLVLEIQDALLKSSQGTFLWVALQIDNLCTMCTDEAIRQALADLPQTLSETFDRILRKFDSTLARSYQNSILEIIVAARYPLTPEELREALSVIPGDTTWDASRLVNDIFGILTCCGSLLTIDEEEKTVRLVHSSVWQFLVDSEPGSKARLTLSSAQKKMADIITTYLNYDIFERQISTRVRCNIEVDLTPAKILDSNFEVPTVVRDIAVNLLKLRRVPGFNMGKTLEQLRARPQTSTDSPLKLLSYAKSNCLFHIACVLESGESQEADPSFLRLLNGTMVDLNTSDGQRLFFAATEKDSEAVVKIIIQSSQLNPNSTDLSGQTPLFLAAASGHDSIVKLLLSVRVIDRNIKSKKIKTLLHIAIEKGHNKTAEILIGSGRVNINAKDHSDRTPLHIALQSLNTDRAARALLQYTSILPGEQDCQHKTPLHNALEGGNFAVAKMLLSSGRVKTNTKDGNKRSPLHLAVEFDFTGEITKFLLQFDSTEPDTDDRKMVTPLHQSVKSNNLPAMKALLESGRLNPPLRVNGRQLNPNRWTVMHAAAQNGDEAMTKLLLSYDQVDANARDYDGKAPLHYGASANNVRFVQCMLKSDKVLANAKDDMGRTPLHVAFMHNSRAVADLLLSCERVQCDVNERDHEGLSPLDYAHLLQNLTMGIPLYEEG